MKEIKILDKESFSSDLKLRQFGYGEWVEELDYIKFIYKDYICHVIRNKGGAFCGYILLNESHPWFGRLYQESEDIRNIGVHGGITFSDFIHENWIIGFDCAHFNDLVPLAEKSKKELRIEKDECLSALYNFVADEDIFNPTYKNIQFCINECKSMVEQAIKAVEKAKKD